MTEPWGYMEENDYISRESNIEREMNDFFADAKYDKEEEAIIFYNDSNEEKARIPMTDIVPSELIKDASYDSTTKEIVIVFDNDDEVRIPLGDISSIITAGDGLVEEDETISVKIDETSEDFMSVSSDGIKISGVSTAIDEAVSVVEEKLEQDYFTKDEVTEMLDSFFVLGKSTTDNVSIPANGRKNIQTTITGVDFDKYEFGAYRQVSLDKASNDTGSTFQNCAIQSFSTTANGTKVNISVKNFSNVDSLAKVSGQGLFFRKI